MPSSRFSGVRVVGATSGTHHDSPSLPKIAIGVAILVMAMYVPLAAQETETRIPGIELDFPESGGRTVIWLPGGGFVHTFVHSIHRTPVDEYFAVRDDGLHLYELRYDTYGAGMPNDAEEGFRLENGRFVLALSRRFESIDIRISPVPGHGIRLGETMLHFTDWAPAGSLVRIRPVVLSRNSIGR